MRKYLKEVGVTAQQAIERLVREEKLAGKGKLKVKMVVTGEGTGLKHEVEGDGAHRYAKLTPSSACPFFRVYAAL